MRNLPDQNQFMSSILTAYHGYKRSLIQPGLRRDLGGLREVEGGHGREMSPGNVGRLRLYSVRAAGKGAGLQRAGLEKSQRAFLKSASGFAGISMPLAFDIRPPFWAWLKLL